MYHLADVVGHGIESEVYRSKGAGTFLSIAIEGCGSGVRWIEERVQTLSGLSLIPIEYGIVPTFILSEGCLDRGYT
jgi:hypothetical protein